MMYFLEFFLKYGTKLSDKTTVISHLIPTLCLFVLYSSMSHSLNIIMLKIINVLCEHLHKGLWDIDC